MVSTCRSYMTTWAVIGAPLKTCPSFSPLSFPDVKAPLSMHHMKVAASHYQSSLMFFMPIFSNAYQIYSSFTHLFSIFSCMWSFMHLIISIFPSFTYFMPIHHISFLAAHAYHHFPMPKSLTFLTALSLSTPQPYPYQTSIPTPKSSCMHGSNTHYYKGRWEGIQTRSVKSDPSLGITCTHEGLLTSMRIVGYTPVKEWWFTSYEHQA